MPVISRFPPILALLAAAITGQAGFAAAPAARASDPWAAVPAWPTACYTSQDKFSDQVNAGRATIASERSRQDEINNTIRAQSGPNSGEDPMAQAQRIQEAMMKDPQHAMEQIKAMGAANPAATTERVQQENARYDETKAADKKFMAQYQAAKKAMLEPSRVKVQALSKRANAAIQHTEAGDFWPDWAYKEAGTIMQEADHAYAALCTQWFGASGKVPAYLKQRREYLVNDRIPSFSRNDPTVAAQAMLGHNAEGYRPIGIFDAVDEYLVLANELYGQRTALVSSCTSLTKCEDQFGLLKD